MKADRDGNVFKDAVMVSKLPLIFSRGKPCSVNDLNGEALVDFVNFLLQCSLGVSSGSALRKLKRPVWWPRTMPYLNFNARREVAKGHCERLRDLVKKCYAAADCCYLLELAGRLAQLFRVGRLKLVSKYDGTTAVRDSVSGTAIVSCRNENVNYDQHRWTASSPRRLLPPHSLMLQRNVSTNGDRCDDDVHYPVVDIYLCDGCATEFSSVEQVEIHERNCPELVTSSISPVEVNSDGAGQSVSSPRRNQNEDLNAHLGSTDKYSYLSLLGLSCSSSPDPHRQMVTGLSRNHRQMLATSPRSVKLQQHTKWRHHMSRAASSFRMSLFNILRRIDISSPLGRRLLSNRSAGEKCGATADFNRFCRTDHTIVRSTSKCHYPVTWKPIHLKHRSPQLCTRVYCFTNEQRKQRRITIRTGLSQRARQLRSIILPCSVRICRLPALTVAASLAGPVTLPPERCSSAQLCFFGEERLAAAVSPTQGSILDYKGVEARRETLFGGGNDPLRHGVGVGEKANGRSCLGREIHTDSGMVVDLCSSDSDPEPEMRIEVPIEDIGHSVNVSSNTVTPLSCSTTEPRSSQGCRNSSPLPVMEISRYGQHGPRSQNYYPKTEGTAVDAGGDIVRSHWPVKVLSSGDHARKGDCKPSVNAAPVQDGGDSSQLSAVNEIQRRISQWTPVGDDNLRSSPPKNSSSHCCPEDGRTSSGSRKITEHIPSAELHFSESDDRLVCDSAASTGCQSYWPRVLLARLDHHVARKSSLSGSYVRRDRVISARGSISPARAKSRRLHRSILNNYRLKCHRNANNSQQHPIERTISSSSKRRKLRESVSAGNTSKLFGVRCGITLSRMPTGQWQIIPARRAKISCTDSHGNDVSPELETQECISLETPVCKDFALCWDRVGSGDSITDSPPRSLVGACSVPVSRPSIGVVVRSLRSDYGQESGVLQLNRRDTQHRHTRRSACLDVREMCRGILNKTHNEPSERNFSFYAMSKLSSSPQFRNNRELRNLLLTDECEEFRSSEYFLGLLMKPQCSTRESVNSTNFTK